MPDRAPVRWGRRPVSPAHLGCIGQVKVPRFSSCVDNGHPLCLSTGHVLRVHVMFSPPGVMSPRGKAAEHPCAEEDDQQECDNRSGGIAPTSTVGPSRRCADKHNDQDEKHNPDEHGGFPMVWLQLSLYVDLNVGNSVQENVTQAKKNRRDRMPFGIRSRRFTRQPAPQATLRCRLSSRPAISLHFRWSYAHSCSHPTVRTLNGQIDLQ